MSEIITLALPGQILTREGEQYFVLSRTDEVTNVVHLSRFGGGETIALTPEALATYVMAESDEDTMARVAANLATVINARDSFRSQLRQAEADIETVGQRLIDESESRGWCSEFDDIIDELNGTLTHALPTRRKEYTVTVRRETTVTVEARSESDAEDMVSDGDVEIDWDYADVEVTEVSEYWA